MLIGWVIGIYKRINKFKFTNYFLPNCLQIKTKMSFRKDMIFLNESAKK